MAERGGAGGAREPALARILICNDDGIDAPGIQVLRQIAGELSDDVWVVAPEQEQSGAAHSLTTRRPLRLWEAGERRYIVDGTPTDCVLLALKRLLRDKPPTLVLSGVNAGSNVAEDVSYSGTVAAAIEATLLGVPAIALSQDYRDRGAIPWASAEACAAEIIRRLARRPWPPNTLYNVNFPAVLPQQKCGFAATHLGTRKTGDNLTEVRDPRGRQYYWIGPGIVDGGTDPGSDYAALAEGKVSVTPIHLDLTHRPLLAALQGELGVTAAASAFLPRKLRLIMELRRAGIGDAQVLGAIEKTPRELFVPDPFQDQAYENVALPIGHAQTISQPFIVALMTEKLELTGRDKLLEIGTGSGYQAAVLARLCRRVFTVERHRELSREAERRFAALRLSNIVTRVADGAKGWAEQAPFDRIIVTAAASDVPEALTGQLAPGGILVLPVGAEHHDQQLIRVRRGESGFSTEELGCVRFVPLVSGLPRAGLARVAGAEEDLALQ